MKQTVERFFKYWQKRNFVKAYRLTQETWQHNHSREQLKRMLGHQLQDFEILEVRDTGELSVVVCRVKIDGVWAKKEARVICETAPYKPSLQGEWGINPISLIRNADS